MSAAMLTPDLIRGAGSSLIVPLGLADLFAVRMLSSTFVDSKGEASLLSYPYD